MSDLTLWPLIAAFVLAAVLGAMGIAAQLLDRRLRLQDYDLSPFRWGYFFGILSVVCGLLLIALGSYLLQAATVQAAAIPLVWGAVNVVAGVLVIDRSRWGWVLATLVSPLLAIAWVVNGIYGYRRWDEFEPRRDPGARWAAERAAAPRQDEGEAAMTMIDPDAQFKLPEMPTQPMARSPRPASPPVPEAFAEPVVPPPAVIRNPRTAG
ncbi:MAG TPA: hypothetical protein VM491_01140, partial [Burkholderiaceae bacterium]|nr:hypothetical protein [Burkholderiaceae bacterium]